MNQNAAPDDDVWLNIAQIRQMFPISEMSLWRWMRPIDAPLKRDRGLGFPRPVQVSKRNYWSRNEVLAWRARQSGDKKEGD